MTALHTVQQQQQEVLLLLQNISARVGELEGGGSRWEVSVRAAGSESAGCPATAEQGGGEGGWGMLEVVVVAILGLQVVKVVLSPAVAAVLMRRGRRGGDASAFMAAACAFVVSPITTMWQLGAFARKEEAVQQKKQEEKMKKKKAVKAGPAKIRPRYNDVDEELDEEEEAALLGRLSHRQAWEALSDQRRLQINQAVRSAAMLYYGEEEKRTKIGRAHV